MPERQRPIQTHDTAADIMEHSINSTTYKAQPQTTITTENTRARSLVTDVPRSPGTTARYGLRGQRIGEASNPGPPPRTTTREDPCHDASHLPIQPHLTLYSDSTIISTEFGINGTTSEAAASEQMRSFLQLPKETPGHMMVWAFHGGTVESMAADLDSIPHHKDEPTHLIVPMSGNDFTSKQGKPWTKSTGWLNTKITEYGEHVHKITTFWKTRGPATFIGGGRYHHYQKHWEHKEIWNNEEMKDSYNTFSAQALKAWEETYATVYDITDWWESTDTAAGDGLHIVTKADHQSLRQLLTQIIKHTRHQAQKEDDHTKFKTQHCQQLQRHRKRTTLTPRATTTTEEKKPAEDRLESDTTPQSAQQTTSAGILGPTYHDVTIKWEYQKPVHQGSDLSELRSDRITKQALTRIHFAMPVQAKKWET